MVRRIKDREGMIMRSLERPSKPVKVNLRNVLEQQFGPGFSNYYSVSGSKLRYKNSAFWGFKNSIQEVADNIKSKCGEVGIDCKIVKMDQKRPAGKAEVYTIWFEIAPTQELEDRVRDDPKVHESLVNRYDREAAERAAKPKPKESLRGERRIVNPGTTPGRFKPNNRLGWSQEQFDLFLKRATPGAQFRNIVKSLAKGLNSNTLQATGTMAMLAGVLPNYIIWFQKEHPYAGVVRLLQQLEQEVNKSHGGRGQVDIDRVKQIGQQLEKRVSVLYDAARTERRLKSMIMAKARKSLGLR